MNNVIIEIDDEMPEDMEERLVQLGFCIANLVSQVVHTMLYEHRVHPAGVVEKMESKIITMNKPGDEEKVRLVAVKIPYDLALEIKNTALRVVKERKEKASAAH